MWRQTNGESSADAAEQSRTTTTPVTLFGLPLGDGIPMRLGSLRGRYDLIRKLSTEDAGAMK